MCRATFVAPLVAQWWKIDFVYLIATMLVIKRTKPSTTCNKVNFVFAPGSPATVVVGGGAGVVAKAATVVVTVTAIMHEGVSYSMGVAG